MGDSKTNILTFRHVLIVGSIINYRRGLAEALLRHLEQPRFSAIDPQSRPLPGQDHDWSDIDLMFIDISDHKASMRSWFFDYTRKDSMPPAIFIDNKATIDDAGDLIRAGAADYIDLKGLKRRRLMRALVIASTLANRRTMAAPDGKYSDRDASDIANAIQSLNSSNEREVDRPDIGKVFVLDDPEATGLLPVVNTDMLSGNDAPAQQPARTKHEEVVEDNPVTEILPELDIASIEKNAGVGNREDAALAAMGVPCDADAPLSHGVPVASVPSPPTEDTARGSALKEPSDEAFLATGLMSILEQNQIRESEEKIIDLGNLQSAFLGQRWPFTHGDIERGKASLGGYDVLEFIGVGGTASVFKVKRKSDGQVFAMKLFDTDSPDNQGRERFARGYRLLKDIDHPYLTGVEELANNGEHTFVITEYFPSGDLKARMSEGIDREHGINYAAQIASALHCAHSNQILHRDLKPSNILFREDGSLALVDFGIAKHMLDTGSQVTLQGQVVGTPYYISPEQATGKDVGSNSDLYALGVIMYEMLEGRRPFDGATSIEIMAAHVRDPIPHLTNRDDALNGVVSRLLSKQAADRFPSGRDVVLAMKSICPNEIQLGILKTIL